MRTMACLQIYRRLLSLATYLRVSSNTEYLKISHICRGGFNVSKTEVILFIPLIKETNSRLNLKINGLRLCPTGSVKYFVIKIDEKLNWNHHGWLLRVDRNWIEFYIL